MSLSKITAVVFILVIEMFLAVRSAHAGIIADSVAEFSDTQGQDNWFYGYWDRSLHSGPYDPISDFQLLPQFFSDDRDRWVIREGPGGFWTQLWDNGGHPNGRITSGDRQSIEHWAIRRWVSTVDGDVTISGTLAKIDPNPVSDGIVGFIFVDGVEVFSQPIAGADSVGVDYEITVTVSTDSLVDFMISPGPNSNDWADSTKFTVVITP